MLDRGGDGDHDESWDPEDWFLSLQCTGGEAVWSGSGADVGQSSAGVVDDGAGDELVIDAGLMKDETGMVSLERAADGECEVRRAGGAGVGGAYTADVVESGADVISLDWRASLADAAQEFGDRVSLQGNLDPCALAAPPEEIRRHVQAMARDAEPARGFVANLGHGCLPGTPVEGVRAFTEAVRGLG